MINAANNFDRLALRNKRVRRKRSCEGVEPSEADT